MSIDPPLLRQPGRCGYTETQERMRRFTFARTPETRDELWLLEHPPVFTLGQAGRIEHVLDPGVIPVLRSDRGGQVTYHGPGQVVLYCLLDLRRIGLGIRSLVRAIEQSMIDTLAGYGIPAFARTDAPGVYVRRAFDGIDDTRKIGSLGLRVRNGCTYHGMALNVDMDLQPFDRIDPCGYRGLRVTQVKDLGGPANPQQVGLQLAARLCSILASSGPARAARACRGTSATVNLEPLTTRSAAPRPS